MNFKFRATRKLIQLFTLCCFIVCGCSTASNTNTRATLNFLTTTSVATQTPISQATSPLYSSDNAKTAQKSTPLSPVTPFDLVAEKFEAFVKWRRDCSYKPRLCNIGEFTIIGTQFSDDFASMMRDFGAKNIFARPGDGERKVTVETISHDESTMTAIVHGCVYDTVVLYMGAGIYDDKVASSLSSWTMKWHNSDWFWTNYQIHKKVYSQNLCNT
ncbi:MAG: hypothetical protein ACO3A0_02210 [Ilumatobacteraceae bacterium]